nr:YciI family protein [uncultured Devosia sp.]
MKYLCIVYAGAGPHTLSEAESVAIKDACIEGDNTLFEAGKLYMASPLQGPEAGVHLRQVNGRTTRIDGPYAETKELVAGFMVIEAANMDEAIAVAAPGPLEGLVSLEIRPLLDESHSVTGQDRSAFFARRS